jgi:hypothetical protein
MRCRLPALLDLLQELMLANGDEHASGRPLIAALRRLPMDSVEATEYVLQARAELACLLVCS